jgi:AcrR family transcriptional regulator
MNRDTHSRLVAAAAELLDGGGRAAVTLREVGRRAGVSHNAPYKHFASKEQLLAAVASRELSRQTEAMAAIRTRTSPIEALRALAHGYIDWARAYPARFKLTFGSWTESNDGLGDAAERSRGSLVALVAAARAKRQLPRGNPDRLASLFLALAHGAVDLALSGHLSAKGKGGVDPEDLVDDLIRHLRIAPRHPATDRVATNARSLRRRSKAE